MTFFGQPGMWRGNKMSGVKYLKKLQLNVRWAKSTASGMPFSRATDFEISSKLVSHSINQIFSRWFPLSAQFDTQFCAPSDYT